MFNDLTMLKASMQMAQHAGRRQAITAANLANADTPGYRAQRIAPFRDVVSLDTAQAARQTRPGHQAASLTAPGAEPYFARTEASPNGNTVSLEEEMLSAVEIQREHSRALMIYKHSIGLIRSSLGKV